MNRLKRRTAASLAALMLLLTVTAVCMKIRTARPLALPAQSMDTEAVQNDPLTRFRTEREQLCQRQRAELNDIIHDDKTDEETLGLAQRQLLELMDAERAELQLEGILNARGFGEVLVSVSAGSVNILMRREGLTRQETAVILDLVLKQTGVTGGNVKIIPIK